MKNLYNALLLKQLHQLKAMGYRYTNSNSFSSKEEELKLPNTINALNNQVKNCHLCSLSKGRKHVVCGEGNSSGNIMFIGDIPQEQEDTEGRIFLGQGGKMLTSMIEKVLNISRNEVYITNLLKCRPQSNQELNEALIHTCKAYLLKEIELVQPKIIVTLGEKAYQYLTNDYSPLEKVRGNIIQHTKYHIVPTYHPRFLLKNPSLKKEVFLDLQKVKKLNSKLQSIL